MRTTKADTRNPQRRTVEYYSILGLDPAANHTAADIQNAYRKLAQKYHPDRTRGDAKAAEQFLAVSRAWDVLGDPEKRARYDSKKTQAAVIPGARKAGRTWGGIGKARKKGEPIRLQVPVRLAEMISGVTRVVQFPRLDICEPCGGTGEHPRISGNCGKCQGTGLAEAKASASLKIRAGVRPGDELTFTGIGSYAEGGGPQGDVVAVISLAAAPGIELLNDTVRQTLVLSIAQAQCGVELRVHLPDGATRRVRMPPGLLPGVSYRLIGGGLPAVGGNGPRGDYILRVGVWIPPLATDGSESITPEIIQSVNDALNSRPGDLAPLSIGDGE